jgi:hypothetical protein
MSGNMKLKRPRELSLPFKGSVGSLPLSQKEVGKDTRKGYPYNCLLFLGMCQTLNVMVVRVGVEMGD